MLVRFRPDASEAQREEILGRRGTRHRTLRGDSALTLLTYTGDENVEAVTSALTSHPAVEFAEPNYLIMADQMVPNDPRFFEQWALGNGERPGGQTNGGINLTQAWGQTNGSFQTIIAVIDSGIDFSHPDLSPNQWTNANERDNNRDNDSNGLSGDIHGWDFVTDRSEIKDELGHGTAVAGIIAAEGNNGIGITGVMWRAALMSLRVLDSKGTGDVAAAVEAIDYAAAHGAKVINLSWGTPHHSRALTDALLRAGQRGVLVVCSAGNEGNNIEAVAHYPASYNLPNVIAVASTDNAGQLTSWSNWGGTHVSIAAPGIDILTTARGGEYRSVTGSSHSAPHVSGVAGLVRTLRPRLSAERTRQMITQGAQQMASLQGKVASNGIISAAGTLEAVESLPSDEGRSDSSANADRDQKNGGNESRVNGNGNAGAGGLGRNAQPSVDPRGAVPVRGRPSSNLPDLNVSRSLRPAPPRARAPIPSTLRNCPPNNPRCANTVNNGNGHRSSTGKHNDTASSEFDTSEQASIISPTFKNRYGSLPDLADLYRPLLLAALQGESLYSTLSAGTMPANFPREGSSYTVSDTSYGLGGLLPPAYSVSAIQGSPTCGASGNASAFISQTVPAVMTAGQSYQVSVRMKNTGSTVWKAETFHRLGDANQTSQSVWRLSRVQLPTEVGTCTEVTFNFTVTAPIPAATQTHNFQWQMVQDGLQWFGTPTDNVAVTVKVPQYEGNLDGATCNSINGWAWDANKLASPTEPDTPIEVDLFSDGNFLARVPADQYRGDLQAAGKGNGRHAFNVVTPPSLRDGGSHQITARVANTTFLPGGSVVLGSSTIGGCSGGGTGSLHAPSNLTVTAVSNSRITLSWWPVSGAVNYQVERSPGGAAGDFTLFSTAPPNTFTDNTVSNGAAYLYRVRAVNSANQTSAYSNVALGTAITFQQASAREIKAVHFTDLRQAVGAVRTAAGFTTSWPEAISPGVSVKADHVREMREGLNQALAALNLTPVPFEDSSLATGANGTFIRYVHVDELRTGSTRASGTGISSVGNNTAGAGGAANSRISPLNRTGQGGTDLLSGNFNWSIPVVSLKGRSGLDLGLSLSYNSKVWVRNEVASAVYFNADNGTPAPGFRLGFPVIQQRFNNSQTGGYSYLMVTPGGDRIELRQDGTTNVYYAADSSYLRLTDYSATLGTMILQSGDGSQLTYGSYPNGYQCTQVKDRNGNIISISYYSHGGINTITDTLDRKVRFNYDANNNVVSITQQRGSQSHIWATFGYSTLPIQHTFSGVTVVGPQNGQPINVLSQVGLSDGSYYKFDYNGFGQVAKISRYSADDHQLSYTAYDFTTETSNCPLVQARKDWALGWNNGSESITGYGYAPDRSWGQMSAPDGTLYKEMFETAGWKQGLTKGTEIWAGGAKQKHTSTDWTQDNTLVAYQLNPRVTESHIYDKEGNHRRTTIDYYPISEFSLPKEIKEYDADTTTVLRRTHLDYKREVDYTSQRIIGLVSARHVYGKNPATGSEELLSKATYAYDETSENRLVPTLANGAPVNPVQHDATYGTNFWSGRANLTSVKRWSVDTNYTADNPQFVESKIGYNVAGSPVFTIDPKEHKSIIDYTDSFSDEQNRNTFAYPTATTDPDQSGQQSPQRSQVRYNYDIGVVTRTQGISPDLMRFPTGPVQTMAYDAVGRIERITNTVNGAYTRFVYAPGQNWVQTFTTIRDVNTEAYSIQVFDGAGRPYASGSDLPGSTGGYKGQHTVYDVMGRAVRASNVTEMTGAWEPADEDPADNVPAGWYYSTIDYDWMGRPTYSTNADGSFNQEISYGGCGCAGGEVVTYRKAMGRRSRLYSDVLGRQAKAEDLNLDGSVYRTATNTFNARDQITRSFVQQGVSGTGQETLMTYDGHGRLATQKAPIQTSATVYTYHDDDTVRSVTDARGAVRTMSYNGRHLVTEVSYSAPAGITGTGTTTFDYDAAGNRLWMDDDAGRVDYRYDQLSRLTTETRQLDGVSFLLSYSYTLSGQLQSLTDPMGSQVSYNYDQVGRTSSMSGTGFGSVSSFASGLRYRAWGALKHADYGNGHTLDVGYNARQQPASYNVPGVIGKQYDYYADGQLRFSDDLLNDKYDRFYEYDQVGRISRALSGAEARGGAATDDRPYREQLGYDVWEHLTTRNSRRWNRTVLFSPQTQHYTNNRNDAWQYDPEGNLTDDGRVQYTTDAAGRTHLVVMPDMGQTQVFDGDGQRVKTVEVRPDIGDDGMPTGQTTTETKYEIRSSVLGGQLVTEVDGATGQKLRTLVYLNGAVMGWQERAYNGAQSVKWEHRDAHNASYRMSAQSGFLLTDYSAELDPMNTNAGLTTPPSMNPTRSEVKEMFARSYPSFGDGEGPGLCIADGTTRPCGEVLFMMGRGMAEQCPYNNCGPRVVSNETEERFAPLVRDPGNGRLGYKVWHDPEREIRIHSDGTILDITYGEGWDEFIPPDDDVGAAQGLPFVLIGFNSQSPGTKKPPCPPVPAAPPGASIDDNIRAAWRRRPQGPVTAVSSAKWFRSMVKPRGDWDYKMKGKKAERGKKAEYEDFGNFNFGATGSAIGFSLEQLLSEGGKVQAVPEGMTEKPKEWGYPAGRIFGSGKYPYGDEPGDAKVVEAGRNYYYHKFVLKDCE